MATPNKRTRFQIDASIELRDLAKEVAAKRRMTLTELVLTALSKEGGDPRLTKLIKKELEEKQPPGRPQK